MAVESLTWPAEPALTDASDGGQNYNMGIRFTVTEEISCVGVRWRVPDTVETPIGGTHAVSIWTDDPVQLAAADFVPSVGGYQNVLFASPITLIPATNYTAAVYTVHYVFRASGGVYPSSPSGIAVADRGQLNAFSGGPNVFPGSGAFGTSTALFYVSPLIDTAEPAVGVTPDSLSVPVTLGAPTIGVVGVTPTSLAVPVTLGAPTSEDGPVVAPTRRSGGWESFGEALRFNADEARREAEEAPVDCPNDGEPLEQGPGGVLHCPADGWEWPAKRVVGAARRY